MKVQCPHCGKTHIVPDKTVHWKDYRHLFDRINKAVPDRTHKGFTAKWTGWKGGPSLAYLVGQWYTMTVTKKGLPLNFYASYPGGEGRYEKGACFDINVYEPQIEPTVTSEPEVLAAAREECWDRLKRVIDRSWRWYEDEGVRDERP